MARLLGEELLQSGIIDERQLEEALDAQLLYGGHLGTCLIELGHVDEEVLGGVLARTFGVKYAPPEVFQNIAADIIGKVPRAVVEKRLVVPFARSLEGLHLAMINPRDLAALDEIAFATGDRVVPWVAPEVRLVQAAERYYDLSRKLRFVSLSRELDRIRGTSVSGARTHPGSSDPAGSGLATAGSSRPRSASGGRGRAPVASLAVVPVAGEDGASPDPGPLVHAARQVHSVAGSLGPSLSRKAPGGAGADDPFRSRTEVFRVSDGADAGAIPTIRDDGEAVDSAATTDSPSLADRLCAADNGEQMAHHLMDAAAARLKHVLLFLIRGNGEFLCLLRGLGPAAGSADGSPSEATLATVFRLLCEHLNYHGPVPPADGFQSFYNTLDLEFPAEIVVLPVHLQNRMVAVFYGDNGRTPLTPVETVSRMTKRFALGLQLALLKRRIRES